MVLVLIKRKVGNIDGEDLCFSSVDEDDEEWVFYRINTSPALYTYHASARMNLCASGEMGYNNIKLLI